MLASASFTDIFFPFRPTPSKVSMAPRASVSSGMSTKPNPRLLPVTLSTITLADLTSPYNSNISFKSMSSRSAKRPATKSFMITKL
jgi:hypothetical protein